MSGARDSKMALWKIVDEYEDENKSDTPNYKHITAVSIKTCKFAQRVRAVEFNPEFQEIAALSVNGYIHIWNAKTFRQVSALFQYINKLNGWIILFFYLTDTFQKTAIFSGKCMFSNKKRWFIWNWM